MPLSKHAISSVKQELRIFCFGYIAAKEESLPKFDIFRQLADDYFDGAGQYITLEDFQLWLAEFHHVKTQPGYRA